MGAGNILSLNFDAQKLICKFQIDQTQKGRKIQVLDCAEVY